jgi:Tol biopolymer transport system component
MITSGLRARTVTLALFAGLASMLAIACLLMPSARGAFRGHPGLIAFDDSFQSGGGSSESECGSSFDAIKTVRPDGTHRRSLGLGVNPAFSPNGRKIAYSVCDGVQTDLMIMNGDGSGAHAVLSTPASEDQAAFSASGKRLFFVRDSGGKGYGDIYSVALDGGSLKRLTRTGGEVGEDSPQAAASGRYVVFARYGRIFTMRPNGTHERFLANGYDPAVAPNSTRIAYSHAGQIFLIGSGGGGMHAVTQIKGSSDSSGDALSPAFSPNGRWIAFALERCVSYGPGCHDSQKLMKVQVDGGKPRRLTTTKVGGFHPDWQPRR